MLILLHDVLGPVYTVHVKFQPSNIAFNTSSKQLLLEDIYFFYHHFPYDFSLNPRRMKAKKERKMKARRMKMKMGKKKRKVKKLGRMRLLQARIETRNIDSSGNLSRCCCNF